MALKLNAKRTRTRHDKRDIIRFSHRMLIKGTIEQGGGIIRIEEWRTSD